MEYWNDIITERSWKILQELKGKFDFILIGGWAVYLLTKKFKSKDIDIIVDFNALEKIKSAYNLSKNDALRKYEIKTDEISIDIYVPFYSEFIIPMKALKTITIEGFNVIKPEHLLILKQAAESSRGHSEKGEKDRLDILSLLFFYDMDFKEYLKILKKIKREDLMNKLINLVKGFKNNSYFNFTPRELKLKKEELIKKLRKI